jgi:hypothetical protein
VKLSAKELGRLPSFVGAVQASQHTAASEKMLKGIVSETHSVANLRHAKVQRARNIVKHQILN